ncbi:ABC-type antimicrobial peptide transport system permease subunit [Chitinophaga polysaccharea]|uniref:ABC-type antimicrobial peptide transport system permease subunit n=1 Tax=Chitinophaga polysaccharea TaxID=1293035 RepID=A0A561P6T8_9BACT|nr:ABC transporter permease [Chitinophaga polysaccharea]TWF33825.1 ABC-type antimicrobial peptide transport system permease subunit [Chitinophaga polysaccharea]
MQLFKIAFRNLFNNKGYSAINIIGLATGMAVTLLIGLWIWDELSFNHVHSRHAHIAQVMDVQTINGDVNTSEAIAIPLAATLRNDFPGDFKHVALLFPNFVHAVTVGDHKLSQSGVWVQPDLPAMLSLKMISGKQDALKDPSSALITRSLANALFGNTDPIGKGFKLDNRTDLQVGGVFEDLPQSSSFYGTQLFLAWDKALSTLPWMKEAEQQWDNRYWKLYVELNEHADLDKINAKIKNAAQLHLKTGTETLFLHPMDQWRLYNEFKNGKVTGGRVRLIWLFGIIGALVLLLACINFMNLATARSAKRSKEVGVRKTIGATRLQLIWQFMAESLLLSALSLVGAMALAAGLLPAFNRLTEKQLSIPFSPVLWSTMIGFALLTGLLAGSYPAFYLSSFRPVKVLKGQQPRGRFSLLPRNTLIVVQFSASIALMIGTVVIYQQIQYGKNRPVGYNRHGLIMVTMSTGEMYGAPYNALRNALLATGAVADMAKSDMPSTSSPVYNTNVQWKGKVLQEEIPFGVIGVTHDYGHTMGWQIKEGRDFSRAYPTDTGTVVLNEAAARLMGDAGAPGELIQLDGRSCRITGIVKDMIMESPYAPVQPTIFQLRYGMMNALTVRINPQLPMRQALAGMAPVFKQFNPEGPFDYTFTDDAYAQKFSDEERIARLAAVFAVLAIFISCLGVWGLAAFMAEQRTKEIGIRKVLGASVSSVWMLLSKDYVRLVLLSLLLATPIAYYGMHSWLKNYPYHITLSGWLFAGAGTATLAVTLLTVSYQSVKAALMNPVKSLATE